MTRAQVAEQIELAMHGVAKSVEKRQTATGTKDKIAQYWIDILLDKARQMKSENRGRSSDDIADELRQWLNEQPGDKINPLLLVEGELFHPAEGTDIEFCHFRS